MSNADLARILAAARDCLDSAKLVSSIRPIVHERVPDYEQCLDMSLSQQFELLSGLMVEYTRFSEPEEEDAEVGEVPSSYADAIRLLDRFMGAACEALNGAMPTSQYLPCAVQIGVRAQTFALLLRSQEGKGTAHPQSWGI